MTHPYKGLDPSRYWRSAAATWGQVGAGAIYAPKFKITQETKIATAGSCFAQHIAAQLRSRGFNFRDYEPAPRGLPDDQLAELGYGAFSARYGNIYTVRQLLTLVRAAFGAISLEEFWEENGRFFDPLRPTIEAGGFSSLEEMLASRETLFLAIRRMVSDVDVFVFTLGLTEAWINRKTGFGYQICPGTTAGKFDAEKHRFFNMDFATILREMERIIVWWRKINPSVRFLLTVSPVPLAATATEMHVVSATSYSKSVLRAVAGELCKKFAFVDYFPSYELITSSIVLADHYQQDRRNVRHDSVSRVMDCFFASHGSDPQRTGSIKSTIVEQPSPQSEIAREMTIICEEALLDAS